MPFRYSYETGERMNTIQLQDIEVDDKNSKFSIEIEPEDRSVGIFGDTFILCVEGIQDEKNVIVPIILSNDSMQELWECMKKNYGQRAESDSAENIHHNIDCFTADLDLDKKDRRGQMTKAQIKKEISDCQTVLNNLKRQWGLE